MKLRKNNFNLKFLTLEEKKIYNFNFKFLVLEEEKNI